MKKLEVLGTSDESSQISRNLGSRIRKWSLLAWSFVLPLVVINGYFGRSLSPMISWIVEDGWCDPDKSEGIGRHCFGDFSDVYDMNPSSPWNWIAPLSISPFAIGIQMGFRLLAEGLGDKQFVLVVFLVAMSACSLIPFIYTRLKLGRDCAAEDFLVLGIGSLPILNALDRGTHLVMAIPALMIFSDAYLKGRDKRAMCCIVLATLVRPQLSLLSLIYLAERNVKRTAKTILWIVATHVLAFLVYPGDRLNNVLSWIRNMVSYQDYGDPLSVASDLSFSRTVGFFLQLVDRFGIELPSKIFAIPYNLSIVVLAPFIISFVALFYWRGQRLSKEMRIIALLILAVSVPQTSYSYYLSYFLVPIALLMAENSGSESLVVGEIGRWPNSRRVGEWILLLSSITTLVPLSIPFSSLIPGDQFEGVSLTQGLAGRLWHALFVFMILQMFTPERWNAGRR